jgi:hypothetical protein
MAEQPIVEAGRLFEAGFMLGVVRALGTLPEQPTMLPYYQIQRQHYHVAEVIDRYAEHAASVADRTASRMLARYHLFSGHVAGYTFLQEYLDGLTARAGAGARVQAQARRSLRVRYLQCSLLGRNRLEDLPEIARWHEVELWLTQLGLSPDVVTDADRSRGAFLNADLLLWCDIALADGVAHDVLVVDTSNHSLAVATADADLTVGTTLLHMLERDVAYLQQRGTFSRLAIETGERTGQLFSPNLHRYFSAFSGTDKESYKLIQAGSYARSFDAFLRRTGVLDQGAEQTYHVVGYSPRGASSMALRADQFGLLEACARIYRDAGDVYAASEAPRDAARRQLLRVIERNAAALFDDGARFVQSLSMDLAAHGRVEHRETLHADVDYQNTATTPPEHVLARYSITPDELKRFSRGGPPTTRAAHAALVWRALASGRRYVFLTGAPGIGKTTTIADYLKEECHQDGYLFLYISPRKTVNRDIFEKFHAAPTSTGETEKYGVEPARADEDTSTPPPFYSPDLLCLTSNSTLIRDAGGAPTVEYRGAGARVPVRPRGVSFVTEAEAEVLRARARQQTFHRVRPVAEDTLHERRGSRPGVLHSLCRGIGAALDTTRPNAIVAAVAIQSLKRNEHGDTLDHLCHIFGGAYNEREGSFAEAPMRALARTTRHIVVMIDEIAGDDAGYAFFQRVVELFSSYHLEQFGFRLTVVVSDASIAGIEVVRAHFALDQSEPDARKIYLTLASETPPDEEVTETTDRPHPTVLPPGAASAAVDLTQALDYRAFDFEHDGAADACLVNSNTYPAGSLHLRYVVRTPIQVLPAHLTRQQRRELTATWRLDSETDQEIIRDIVGLLASAHGTRPQTIVYVQNKQRLQVIMERVRRECEETGVPFVEREDYVQVHAENAEDDLACVLDPARRDRLHVIFMTSSASRGISFPKATRLLIDVPRFQIESNLMEIVQVLYRGRGDHAIDLGEKEVTFYFTDRILAPEGAREGAVREGVMGVLTILSLLKLCVLTRMVGAARLRDRAIALIPIGGKSVGSAGQAFHHDLSGFVSALAKAMRGERTNDHALKQLHMVATRLLHSAHLNLEASTDGKSYLSLYEEASQERIDAWITSDDEIEGAYTLGSLLLVPLDGRQLETIHSMDLDDAIALSRDPKTGEAMRSLFGRRQAFAPSLIDGLKDFQELLAELADTERSQRMEHLGAPPSGYYVLPLAAFVAKESIARHCEELALPEHGQEGYALRDVLMSYVRDAYPLDTVLPIGSAYRRVPFLVVTSQDLAALRAKRFRLGHALMSHEMNLLTLLLAEE